MLLDVNLHAAPSGALTPEEENKIVSSLSQGGFYSILERGKSFGPGIADKYRTPAIMDALLDLIEHPERIDDDEEFMARRALFTMATDSRDPRMVAYICEYGGGEQEVRLALANRMPKEAYNYALKDNSFFVMLIKDLLEGTGLLSEEQRQTIRKVLLERLAKKNPNEMSGILKALELFVRNNDEEVIDIVKKYAKENWGTDINHASVNCLGQGAQAGNVELIDFLKWISLNHPSVDSQSSALRNLAKAAVAAHRPDLFGDVDKALELNIKNPRLLNPVVITLEDLTENEQSAQAEAILQKLAQNNVEMAQITLKFIEIRRQSAQKK